MRGKLVDIVATIVMFVIGFAITALCLYTLKWLIVDLMIGGALSGMFALAVVGIVLLWIFGILLVIGVLAGVVIMYLALTL